MHGIFAVHLKMFTTALNNNNINVKNLFKQVIIHIVSFVETTDDDLINNHGDNNNNNNHGKGSPNKIANEGIWALPK